MPKDFDKLNKLFELLQNDTITPKEIEQFLTVVLKYIADAKDSFDSLSKENLSKLNSALVYIQSKSEDIANDFENQKSELLETVNNKVVELQQAIDEVKAIEVKDGEDADEEYIITEVLKRVELPVPEKLELDDGLQIANKLEDLKGDDRLDASAIKNLDEYISSRSNSNPNGGGWRNLFQLHDIDFSTQPTNGQVLTYNGTTKQWYAANGGGGGTGNPGGSNTQLQFNDSGSFGGSKLDYTDSGFGTVQLEVETGEAFNLQSDTSITTTVTDGVDSTILGIYPNGYDLYSTATVNINSVGAYTLSSSTIKQSSGTFSYIFHGSNTPLADGALDFSGLTTDHTFTFPDATGTIALISDIPSTLGFVTTDQSTPQTIGTTGNRLTKLWAIDLTVTNAISGSITGNAGTAAALQNARTIGGVSFDGTVNITVATATGGFTISGGDLAMSSNKITGLSDPSSAQDAATKAYVDNAVIGLLDYRGSYDASTNLFPATGGSGLVGAVLKGDFWVCSVGGTLGGVAVTPGDLIISLVDTPGQTAANWDLIAHDLGSYVTSITGTANQVVASASTGAVTLSLPQSIATTSTPQFAKLGIGVAADASRLLLVQGDVSGGIATFNRTNASTNAAVGTVIVRGTSTGDMVDGFGSAFQFAIQDTAAVENLIANIQGIRDGADNSGKLVFATYNAGTPTTGMTISKAQVINLGTTSVSPLVNDGASLGTTSVAWSDLFGATGFVFNINSDWIATHTAGILTVGTGDLRVTTAGTNSASVVTNAGTQTLTNKRITSRVLSASSYTTDTGSSINGDTQDMFIVTAQAGALKFNNPSGTPTDGQRLIITVASSTTAARALTWDTLYGATTVALPTTTTATTATLSIGFIYSTSKTLWQCVAVA